ncbi:Retrovirus-related Pol polyprotein from transposon, partial [Nosema granulosis]
MSRRPQPYCEIHGYKGHSSDECRTLQYRLKEGWRRPKEVRRIDHNETTEDLQDEKEAYNKADYIYSINAICSNNPFFVTALFFGRLTNCLIDTGADVSLIHKDMIPHHINRSRHQGTVKSACGTSMTITAQLKNSRLKIMGMDIEFSPLVTNSEPGYIILGADVIRNPLELLWKAKQPPCKHIDMVTRTKEENVIDENLIFNKHAELFRDEIDGSKACTVIKHKISTEEHAPIYARTGRVPIHYEQAIHDEIQRNLRLGIIKHSKSPWSSRIVPVTKKDGSLRMCIDYRLLNKITVKDKYPLPRIDEILDSLAGVRVFSTLDATSGYYQLELEERAKEKTAFSWKGG